MQKVIINIQEIDKILHDVKFALNSIAKACEPFSSGFTERLADAANHLSDVQDRLNKAIEHLNNE